MGLDLTALRGAMLAGIRSSTAGLVQTVFPPRCIACGEAVSSDFGLCGACWRDTQFIAGLRCECCGAPLPGDGEGEGAQRCDDCLAQPRNWSRGRAAFVYGGAGRQMVLALKHGDRLDLVGPMGQWLAQAAGPLLEPGMVIAPIPLHRLRLIKRKFNQSALLSQQVAKRAGLEHIPDLFERPRATPSQEGRSREERFANLEGAIRVTPRRAEAIRGRDLLIVDDVMTSGATFAAATEAALAAGARRINVLALARVAKGA